MLREVLGENSLSQTVVFEWLSHFKAVVCQLKMTNVQGDQAPAKKQKMLNKFENSSTKSVANKPMSSQTPLGSVMEFAEDILTENLNMRHTAVKFVP
jgi:hypothetical protein